MTSGKRRKFTAEEKVAILRKHLLEGVAVSDVCDEHGLNPTQFYRWQQEFFQKGAAVFESKRGPKSTKTERRMEKLEAELEKKNMIIAEVTAELIMEKKRAGES
jgi:transposase-like protein